MLPVLNIIEGKDNKVIYKKIANIKKDMEKAINLAFLNIADLWKQQVDFDLNDKASKTGTIYLVESPTGETFLHQASAPGEAPATMFGNLERSIRTEIGGQDMLKLQAGNQTNAPYAEKLELGLGIAERPYMIKAIHDIERDTQKYFMEHIKKCLSEL